MPAPPAKGGMKFGDYRVEVVPDAEFWLDGGAMFGVVPRALWARESPPDAENRVRLNMNCLFVEACGERILVETGIGDKWTARRASLYGIARERTLEESLEALTGCGAGDITVVVNTHLHFDHAGGNTRLAEDGRVVPAFPNARYFVSREIVPGLTMENIAGHSRTMQCVRLERGGRTLYGFADLVPTRAHVAYAWIMGYDLYPVETLEAKKRLLPRAAREGWLCLFYHDADAPLCRIVEDEGRLRAVAVETASTG